MLMRLYLLGLFGAGLALLVSPLFHFFFAIAAVAGEGHTGAQQ